MKNRQSYNQALSGESGDTTGLISRNAMSLLSSRIFEYIGLFAFSIYYIPKLGPQQYGLFKYATSFTGFFFNLADFGLGMMIIREIAHLDQEKRKRIIGLGLSLKIFLAFLTFGLILFLSLLIHRDPHVRSIICLLGITTIFNSMVYFFYGVFQGYEKMHLTALVRVLTTALICLAGWGALEQGFGIMGLAVANIIGNAAGVVFSLFFARKLWKGLFIRFERGRIVSLLKTAFPFGLFTFFSVIYIQIDNVMIYHIRGEEDLGIYAAATRIVIAVCFFTEAFMGTLYPMFSRFFIEDRKKLEKTYERAFWFLYITGLPAVIGLWRIANPLIVFLFGQTYEKSGPILSLLSVLIFLRFIDNVPATLLSAIGKQFIRTWMVIGASAMNIILNLFLIPRYSYYGAAYSSLLVNFLLVIIYYCYGYKAGMNINRMIPRIVKPTIATGIMLVFLMMTPQIHVVFRFFLGIIIYALSLILLGSFNSEEKELFRRAIGGIIRGAS
ncbi:flippase [Candidatus Sumerlaeota bacterium]|nr:flippase [Candidatus Sumerlaeota bacterium]